MLVERKSKQTEPETMSLPLKSHILVKTIAGSAIHTAMIMTSSVLFHFSTKGVLNI